MTLSLVTIWKETLAFVSRERALLVPLALATIAVGDAGLNLTGVPPLQAGPGEFAPGQLTAMIASVLLGWTGQLAVFALVLFPGLSVGEALRKGLTRLPWLILVLVLVFVGVLLLALPLGIMLAANGLDLTVTVDRLPGYATFYMFLLSAFAIWVGARLLPLNAALVDRERGAIEALGATFAMTKGFGLLMIALGMLYLSVFVIVSALIGSISSGLFGGLGSLIGSPLTGKVLAALLNGVGSALLGVYSTVFTALLYRHLQSRTR